MNNIDLTPNKFSIIKDYYNQYLNLALNSSVSIDKFLYQIQINTTLYAFVELCISYNICLIYTSQDTLMIKTNKMLLEECNKIKHAAYTKCIIKLYELMNNKNEWIDNNVQIDKNVDDLKKVLKDVDLLQDLLINVYTDLILMQQFKNTGCDCKSQHVNIEADSYSFGIIEEFSNKKN